MLLREKRALAFGGTTVSGSRFASGIPGPGPLGGALFVAADAGTSGLRVQKLAQSAQKIILKPSKGAQYPLVGVSIAPDSAIHTCDIWVGGGDEDSNHHRISPGNMLMGIDPSLDFALVTIPNPIPDAGDSTGQVTYHDTIPIASEGGIKKFGWPLRLELWYGCLIPKREHIRAAYVSDSVFNIPTGQTRTHLICVDGRKRIDVIAYTEDQIVSVSCAELIGVKNPSPNEALDSGFFTAPLDLTGAGVTSVALTVGVPRVFSFFGNPMTVLQVILTNNSGSTTDAEVRVIAWDE